MAVKKTITKKNPKKTKAPKVKTALVEEDFSSPDIDFIDIKPLESTTKIKPVTQVPLSVSASSENLPVTLTEHALTSNDPLITYLNEIRKYPLLSREEEHELAVRYKEKGDKQAAEKLVTSNLRFVVKIAAEYSRFGAKMIDLIQEGNVGLMHAVKEFNPYKGVKLITYAVWWIKGYIREYLMRQHSMVRVGTTQAQKKLFYNLNQETRKLEALGEDAAVDLLSERLGVSQKDVRDMKQRMSGRDVSLDQPFDSDSDSNMLSYQKDESADPEETFITSEQILLLRDKIDKVLPLLNSKEKYILEERLLSDEPITLQEVGDKFKITRERARQLESRVLSKIKAAFEEQNQN